MRQVLVEIVTLINMQTSVILMLLKILTLNNTSI